MSNKIFIEKPIRELPKESGWYVPVYNNDQIGDTFIEFDEYWLMNRSEKKKITHWLKTVTLPELLAEHPEIVEQYRREMVLKDRIISELREANSLEVQNQIQFRKNWLEEIREKDQTISELHRKTTK